MVDLGIMFSILSSIISIFLARNKIKNGILKLFKKDNINNNELNELLLRHEENEENESV